MKKVLLSVTAMLVCTAIFSQSLQWQKLLGGSGAEIAYAICHTTDGGSIVAGVSSSSTSSYVKGTNHGSSGNDIWVVKLNASGDTLWEKLYGGSGTEYAYAVQQTADGGYIVAGYSSSSASGNVTDANHGVTDVWILKLDASGNIIWQKLYGGSGTDICYAAQQTADGGYIVAGYSSSSASGDVTGTNHSAGNYDEWIIKLDASGNITWQKLLGGSGSDQAYAVQQTTDGGYIMAGYTSSSANGDVTGTNRGGTYDYWIVKLDASGNITWQKLYGGSGADYARSIKQTSDGGYIVAGYSASSASGEVTGTTNGSADYWVLKLDVSGNITWQKLYGGSGNDQATAIQQTSDGGYIVGGYSSSSAIGDVTGTSHGGTEDWIVKLSASGNIVWQKLYGGSGSEYVYAIDQTTNGDYVVAGYSTSSASGDVTATNSGGNDYWVLSLSGLSVTPVTLKSFTGTLANGCAFLLWQCGVESNFNHYTIEQSIDGKTFTSIASIAAKGSNQSYSYKLIQAASTAYYRLAMADNDGSVSYSPVLSLSQKNTTGITVYPNPAQDYINITAIEAGTLKIYNAKGALIETQTVSAGTNKISIRDLSAGMYYGSVNTGKFSFIKE